METKHHWLMGLVVAILVVVAFVQGSMVSNLRQRVGKLEGNMASSSQMQAMPDSTTAPSTQPMQTTPSTPTNPMSPTNKMTPMNQQQPPKDEEEQPSKP